MTAVPFDWFVYELQRSINHDASVYSINTINEPPPKSKIEGAYTMAERPRQPFANVKQLYYELGYLHLMTPNYEHSSLEVPLSVFDIRTILLNAFRSNNDGFRKHKCKMIDITTYFHKYYVKQFTGNSLPLRRLSKFPHIFSGKKIVLVFRRFTDMNNPIGSTLEYNSTELVEKNNSTEGCVLYRETRNAYVKERLTFSSSKTDGCLELLNMFTMSAYVYQVHDDDNVDVDIHRVNITNSLRVIHSLRNPDSVLVDNGRMRLYDLSEYFGLSDICSTRYYLAFCFYPCPSISVPQPEPVNIGAILPIIISFMKESKCRVVCSEYDLSFQFLVAPYGENHKQFKLHSMCQKLSASHKHGQQSEKLSYQNWKAPKYKKTYDIFHCDIVLENTGDLVMSF